MSVMKKLSDYQHYPLNEALLALGSYIIPINQLNIDEAAIVGRGGFGVVYRAKLLGHASEVAVKRLRSDEYKDNRRLVREMRVWSKLKHQNILPLIGFYLSANLDEALIVCPLEARGNLKDYLDRERPSDCMRLTLALDTLYGLVYLHDLIPPVVHGDLKALNVLLNEDNRAVLCDFGLAIAADENSSGLTTSQGLKGSIRYCSPELVENEEPRSTASDVWSWACLLVEIIKGTIPYAKTRSEITVLLAISRGILPESEDLLRSPVDIWPIVDRCWKADPHQRVNAVDCIEDLHALAVANIGSAGIDEQPILRNLLNVTTMRPLKARPLDDSLLTASGNDNVTISMRASGRRDSWMSRSTVYVDCSDDFPGEALEKSSGDSATALGAFPLTTSQSVAKESPKYPSMADPDSLSTNKVGGHRIRDIGNYQIGKTIGAGSIGKVKIAHHNLTGEKFAIKIIPRVASTEGVKTVEPSAPHLSVTTNSEAFGRREIRIVREASLGTLLHHPHICGMRELIVDQDKYYLVLEFVEGGSMLDYIISHGRLRERVARKFARQIASALHYCHQNSVVHRGLRIEDIMVGLDGDIKIIDFGVANFWNQDSLLTTLCGSGYFAAPEILCGKHYNGPKADVWSFGVVLYVLVCGRVPFDDTSMLGLTAKIKGGVVSYPSWLSKDCRNLLLWMLASEPKARATVEGVLTHPWMLRGFPGPPSPYLPDREPIQPIQPNSPIYHENCSPLDQKVIRGMTGFEFGTEAEIEAGLIDILSSNSYHEAVEAWHQSQGGVGASANDGAVQDHNGGSRLTNTLSPYVSGSSRIGIKQSTPSKGFLGINFLRKVLGVSSTSQRDPSDKSLQLRNPPTLSGGESSEQLAVSKPESTDISTGRSPMGDPTHAFHPLISVYFLVQEKMQREHDGGPRIDLT
ncbi:serine/threonine-protein kinase KIN2 [Tulasnella sp. 332]|nr:serine/threonine-protein kinase KIN2 [Tulasnella sp. 332]